MQAAKAISSGSLRQPNRTAVISRAKIMMMLSGRIVKDSTSSKAPSQSRSRRMAKMAAKESAAMAMSGKTADVIGP
ncbi:hypothetical protein D3C80_1762100 [compost metagenome]